MKKPLPAVLTSYDLIKALALILMVVDHLGAYFFPYDMWFRAVGRLCVPVWFFLAGYSSSREIPRNLWTGGAVVTLIWVVSGRSLFPLNALFAIIAIRWCLDSVMARALRSYAVFWGMILLLILGSFPSNLAVEYGTLALLFAMLGFIRRHKAELRFDAAPLFLFTVAVVFVFVVNQLVFMPAMSAAQFAVVTLGTYAMTAILFAFEPREYPVLDRYLWIFSPVLKFMGRRTLEIYVIHLAVFSGLGMALHPEIYRFMNFEWVSAPMLQLFSL